MWWLWKQSTSNCFRKIFKKFSEGSFDANEITEKKVSHTIDIISSIIDGLFLLGKIAAKHALNDLIAANSNYICSDDAWYSSI